MFMKIAPKYSTVLACVCICMCAITSYLASSPLRRPMSLVISRIRGSRLEGSPICGFCSYTPFIFSRASLTKVMKQEERGVNVWGMWCLRKSFWEHLLSCCFKSLQSCWMGSGSELGEVILLSINGADMSSRYYYVQTENNLFKLPQS